MDQTMITVGHHEPAKQLTDDLLVEILSRLPIKSLFRFKCLSKSWLALIVDCYTRKKLPSAMIGLFCHNSCHLKTFVTIPSAVGDGASVDTSLSFLPMYQGLTILDCCNGLLLCHDYHSMLENGHYYVCNPATKKWATVPCFHGAEISRQLSLALVFDPRVSCHYNIIRISERKSLLTKMSVEVFSSKTGKWAEINGHTGLHIKMFDLPLSTLFFNGNVHVLDSQNNVIAGINLEGQVCCKIKFPQCSTIHGRKWLGHSGGCLHYALQAKGEMRIWVLENYDDGHWTQKHSVALEVKLDKQGFCCQISSVAFHPDLDVLFLVAEPKVLAYNLKTGELAELCGSNSDWYIECHVYSPCYSDVLGL